MTHSEQELLEKTLNLIKVNVAHSITECRIKIDDTAKSMTAIHHITMKLIDIAYKSYEDAVKINIPVGYEGIHDWEEELNAKMKRYVMDTVLRWSKS